MLRLEMKEDGGSVIVCVERVSVTIRYPACKWRGIKKGKENGNLKESVRKCDDEKRDSRS